MRRLKLFPVFICLFLVVLSCDNEKNDPNPLENTTLIKSEYFRTYRAADLKILLRAAPFDLDMNLLKYDADIYKVEYRTTYQNEEITASGLVAVPLIPETESAPMVSFQHGTMVAHSEAPSLVAPGEQSANFYAALASTGFITVIPDYIGFGASSEISHPYYVEIATATAILDNLKAAKELASEKQIGFDGRLFLAGYSQGGYATMATHKAIEENGLEGFELKASFPASGGYDVKGMESYFFNLDTYHEPFYIAYVAHAYATYYDWTEPFSNFFKEPYASMLPQLFDGSKNGTAINAALNDSISLLIQEDLLLNPEDAKYAYLNDAFLENSLLDWTPEIPMYMYHGNTDITVPYENSVHTYNTLIANGANAQIVTFTELEGNHSSAVGPYIEAFMPVLISLK